MILLLMQLKNAMLHLNLTQGLNLITKTEPSAILHFLFIYLFILLVLK